MMKFCLLKWWTEYHTQFRGFGDKWLEKVREDKYCMFCKNSTHIRGEKSNNACNRKIVSY